MVSIIIATYNEETVISRTLSSLSYDEDIEVIVVDGESDDRTLDIACKFPVKTLKLEKNRAHQLNEGSKLACGDILIFLHADCTLEPGSIQEIKRCIQTGHIGGCLSQVIKNKKTIYRFIENAGNLRAKILKIFYGDQAIFVRHDEFSAIGGFDDVELFDDILFSKKLRKKGKTAILNKKVYTYPRRWQKQGIFKTTVINWLITAGFILKIPPRILKRIYQDIR